MSPPPSAADMHHKWGSEMIVINVFGLESNWAEHLKWNEAMNDRNYETYTPKMHEMEMTTAIHILNI